MLDDFSKCQMLNFDFETELKKKTNIIFSKSFSEKMDFNDPLRHFCKEFHIAKIPPHNENSKQSIYLCGNSLGCMPKRAMTYVQEELTKWSLAGVEGHFTGDRPWVSIDEKCVQLLIPLVGAKKGTEIVVMNTLSVNCHLFFTSFFQPTKTRFKILMESQAFCSDHHIVRSQLNLHGLSESSSLIEIEPRIGESCIKIEDLLTVLEKEGDSIALVFLGGVNFFTGQFLDIKKITEAAHSKGCYVGFDLAHCIGNIPVKLHDWNVDFATWCHYKYCNSGPGCIAGAFLHEKHHYRNDLKRLDGWWGQKPSDRFDMRKIHSAILGAQAYQLSNPAVLPMVCLQASLELFQQANINNLRKKSINLTRFLELLLKSQLPEIEILTPSKPEERGAQLSLRFPIDIKIVYEKLGNIGIICDIRRPNIMRIAPAPIYNSFTEVFTFVQSLVKLKTFWN